MVMKIARLSTPFLIGIFVATFSFGMFAGVDVAQAAKQKKTAAELDAAKKEGDLSVEAAEKLRDAYGKEADEANIESFETKTNVTGSGTSTYGVVGFDYLTGVGKVASDPTMINETVVTKMLGVAPIKSANKSPLEDLMKKRFTKNEWTGEENKSKAWTGQANKTYSGLTERTGVTEAWFRHHETGSKLGGDYNEWANQWNNITRPRHGNKTPVAGADPDQGAQWFSVYCVHCHGWTGKGDGPTAAKLDPRPRNLTNGKYANYISNLDLFVVIKGGGAARNLGEAMPPWGNILQDQDIWNTVAFIRTLSADYVADADDVTAANAKKSEAFKEANEMLELEGAMAGRGGGLVGGYDSIGGGRFASKKVGLSESTSDANPNAKIGDWAEDTK